MDKQRTKGEKNWPKKHMSHINVFKDMVARRKHEREHGCLPVPTLHDDRAFNEYLAWLKANTRLKLNTSAFRSEDILAAADPPFYHLANLEYNKLVRQGRHQDLAPVINIVVSFCFYTFDVPILLCSYLQT